MAAQKPEEVAQSIRMMIPATNLKERTEIVLAAKASMLPEVFKGELDLVKSVLSPDDWSKLKSRIGVK